MSDAWLTQLDARRRQPVQHRYLTDDSRLSVEQDTDKDWSTANEEWNSSGVGTWMSRQDRALEGQMHAWPEQLDVRGRRTRRQSDNNAKPSKIIEPETDMKWSEVEKTSTYRAVPFDSRDLISVPEWRDTDVEQGRCPTTICHVRVTVRHRSLQHGQDGKTDFLSADSGELTPVPALRRAGTSSRRSSPAGRRVTFSPTVDERQPMFATVPRYHRNTVHHAALDTLWHYHETYPCIDSHLVGQPSHHQRVVDLPQSASDGDGSLPEAARYDNEDGTLPQFDDVVTSPVEAVTFREESGGITRHHAPYSPPLDDYDDDGSGHRGQDQQEQRDVFEDEAESELTSLSIKQLVASFESMTSPFMRAPVLAKQRAE